MTRASSQKQDRIDLRVRKDTKELIAQAAALMDQTVSEFIVSIAVERSRKVISRSTALHLTEIEVERFAEALRSPPDPAQLRAAAERYRKAVEQGELKSS